jgi:hypothetical protein
VFRVTGRGRIGADGLVFKFYFFLNCCSLIIFLFILFLLKYSVFLGFVVY